MTPSANWSLADGERDEVAAAKPDGWPNTCASCGAAWTDIGFDYALGFNCRACGRSDAEE